MLANLAQQVIGHHLLDTGVTRLTGVTLGQCDGNQAIEMPQQLGALPLHVQYLAVVRQIHRLRLQSQQAPDRCPHFLGLELGRRRRWKDELPPIDIQLTVGQAEHIARENPVCLRIDNTDVVSRMPRRIEATQLPAIQIDNQAVDRLDDALGRHRQYLAVHALDILCPIHRRYTGYQPRRFRHVAGPTRMHDQLGVREGAHQTAGPAGMIEVDVGQYHVIHCRHPQPYALECSQGIR